MRSTFSVGKVMQDELRKDYCKGLAQSIIDDFDVEWSNPDREWWYTIIEIDFTKGIIGE